MPIRAASRRNGTPLRGEWLGTAALAVCLCAGAAGHAAAQTAHKAIPHRSHPVPLSRAAPDTTGTIRTSPSTALKAGTPPAPEDLSKNEPLGQPFELPAAPRGRLRACGEQWHAKKMDGSVGTDTWREFATSCLTSKENGTATADR